MHPVLPALELKIRIAEKRNQPLNENDKILQLKLIYKNDNLDENLFNAVEHDDIEAVRLFLAQGANPDFHHETYKGQNMRLFLISAIMSLMLCSCTTKSSISLVSPNSEIANLTRTENENSGESSIPTEINSNPTEDDNDESSEQSECDIEDDHEFKPEYIVQIGKHKSLIVTKPDLHWKNYEEKRPLPILRVTSDEDLITKLESTLKSHCEISQSQSASGYIAQSLYCAKKCDDDGECIADLYVSLKSSKDNVTRVYDISKHRIADNVFSRDDMYIRDNTELKDIAVLPFLDTEAVYARFAETHTLASEHYSGGESESNETVTIYLFAGDKLRLAGQWTDYTSETFSSYERFSSNDGEDIFEEKSHTTYTTYWATFDGEKITENEEYVANSQAMQARIKDHLDALSRAKSTNPELQIAPEDITKFIKE